MAPKKDDGGRGAPKKDDGGCGAPKKDDGGWGAPKRMTVDGEHLKKTTVVTNKLMIFVFSSVCFIFVSFFL